jgi:lipoprotein signal peptidase
MNESQQILPPGQTPSRFFRVALFLIVCALGLSADLFTKWLTFQNPSTKLFTSVQHEADRWVVLGADEKHIVAIPKLLHFHATVNEGAVFGLGQGQQFLFVAVSVAAIAFLVYLASRTRSRFEVVLLGCLLAGVLGNMYDRIRYEYVRDMILALPGVTWPGAWKLPLINYPGGGERLVFPYIFNVADCLLVCGVAVLLIRSFFTTESKAHEQKQTTDEHRSTQTRTE